ncbi:MAG: hormogonium polysaccharide biosynthesis protein HpsL [Cyanobacterium sp.]
MTASKTQKFRNRKRGVKNAPLNAPAPLSRKEKIALKRQETRQKQKLVSSWAIALILGILTALPSFFLFSPKVGISAGIGIMATILSYQFPRSALWAFLIYMPFGGTVVYAFAGGNLIFQIAKDVFYIPALFALLIQAWKNRKPIIIAKPLLPTLMILSIVCLIVLIFVNLRLELFAPACSLVENVVPRPICKNGQPFLQGLLGLKIFIGYIPLMFCGYHLIEDKKTLLKLGRLLAVLAIICCLLALVQYSFLRSGRCQATSEFTDGAGLFRASLDARCFVGGSLLYTPEQNQIRLPGTFVSPWHWGWFLIANSAICFSVAFFETSRFWQLIGLGGMGLIFINTVISGQRVALFLVPVFLFVMLVLTGQLFRLKRFIPIAVILAIAGFIFVSANPDIVTDRVNSAIGRWNASPPQDFIIQQWRWVIRNTRSYGGTILGSGLGTATNSARTFGSIAFIETYHPKVIYEVGIMGLITFLAFITHIVIYTFKKYRSIQDPTLKSFASAFWVFLLFLGYFPYWYPLDTDPVAVYYWLFAGVLIKLTIIDKQERDQEVQTILSKNRKNKKKFKSLKKRRTASP